MSATIAISDSLAKALDLFEGLSIEEKISNSLEAALLNRLKVCNEMREIIDKISAER